MGPAFACCRKEINALPYKEAVVTVVGSVGGYWNSHVCVSQPTNQIMPSAEVRFSRDGTSGIHLHDIVGHFFLDPSVAGYVSGICTDFHPYYCLQALIFIHLHHPNVYVESFLYSHTTVLIHAFPK